MAYDRSILTNCLCNDFTQPLSYGILFPLYRDVGDFRFKCNAKLTAGHPTSGEGRDEGVVLMEKPFPRMNVRREGFFMFHN